MINPYFLTLTLRNVDGFALRPKIKQMFKTWERIRDSYRKKYPSRKVIGFLKLECTYNRRADTYHPHFHFLGEGDHFCNYAKDKWFFHYKKECYKTYQKSIKVTLKYHENGDRNFKELKEIFKYVAKVVSGQNKKEEEDDALINAKSLDTIYCAMSHIRCLRFYGLKKKQETKEEIEAIESDEAPESAEELEIFVWRTNNWYSTDSGEALTDFVPNEKELNFEKMIEKGKLLRQKLM
jgi:enamine deaminase RidA (YjgF/YER057c/UK114 family)